MSILTHRSPQDMARPLFPDKGDRRKWLNHFETKCINILRAKRVLSLSGVPLFLFEGGIFALPLFRYFVVIHFHSPPPRSWPQKPKKNLRKPILSFLWRREAGQVSSETKLSYRRCFLLDSDEGGPYTNLVFKRIFKKYRVYYWKTVSNSSVT